MTTVALVGFISLGVLLLAGALLAALDIWASPSRSRLVRRRRDPDLFIDQWRSERRQRLIDQQRQRPPAAAGPRLDRHPVDRTFWGHR